MTSDGVGAGGVGVTRIINTFVFVNTFDRAKVNRNVGLISQLIWKEWSISLLTSAFVLDRRHHINADGTTGTRKQGGTLINVLALRATVPRKASASANNARHVDSTRSPILDTKGSISAGEPAIERSTARCPEIAISRKTSPNDTNRCCLRYDAAGDNRD